MVSLPCIEKYVQATNEADAVGTLHILAQELDPEQKDSLGELLKNSPLIQHRLQDARSLHDGTALLHHGYVFELRQSVDEACELVAWPRRSAEQGGNAFSYSSTHGLLAIRMRQSEGRGEHRTALPSLAHPGWRSLDRH